MLSLSGNGAVAASRDGRAGGQPWLRRRWMYVQPRRLNSTSASSAGCWLSSVPWRRRREDALERLGVLEAGQRIVVVGGEVEDGGGAVVEAGEETEVPVGEVEEGVDEDTEPLGGLARVGERRQ